MKVLTYLIYTILYECLIIGGCGYVVFGLHQSGWWFVLAAIFSMSQYSPEKWAALWNNGAVANGLQQPQDASRRIK